jgi:carboxylesterase type B
MFTKVVSKVKKFVTKASSESQTQMDFSNFLADTQYGSVQGVQKISTLDREFVSFQGIPFMKAPIGKLRFQDPQPPENWKDPFDASDEPASYCFYHPNETKGGLRSSKPKQ